MGKSKQSQWIPSTGVLLVAAGAAVVAAILVNVYIGYVKSQYEYGSELYLQLKADVEPGNPIQEAHLTQVRIPRPLLPAFSKAIKVSEKESLVLNKKAPRKMYRGEFLWAPDFLTGTGLSTIMETLPAGYELVSIPINPDNNLGRLLQPGSYVNIRGDFDVDPDPKRDEIQFLDVMSNVQVKALGGSTQPVTERGRTYSDIQIMVKASQARQLLQVQKALKSRRFTVSLTTRIEGALGGEPQIDSKVLEIIQKVKPAPSPEAAAP